MTELSQFLSDKQSIPYPQGRSHGFGPGRLFLGNGINALEVLAAWSGQSPSRAALLDGWKARRRGRAAPLLFVVLHPNGAVLCGASGEKPPVYDSPDGGQVERLCREALAQPDRHAALQFLSQALPSLETALPGLNNEGLLALHELQHGVPSRTDWTDAKDNAVRAVGKRDEDLLRALGFRIEQIDNLTSLLRSRGSRTALAVTLRESESPEAGNDRFNSLSPISYAFKKADDENLSWVMLVQGSRLRLYATAFEAGVGRRGRTETYIECQPTMLANKHLPYLWLIYSADALGRDGSLSQILDGSQRFSGALAERLRERVYDEVVPRLAQGVAAAQGIAAPKQADLHQLYEMALMILFRLLFIAYAEDRDLLPYRSNEAYRRRSLKQKAQELANHVIKRTAVAEGDSHWQEVKLLWDAIASGNAEWGVPAYDGGLFTQDPAISASGALLAGIALPNETFEAALCHLLVIETPEGVPGPVDFRSLGVREFGTIYEGLLESELAVAETDLVLKKQKNELVYIPARSTDQPDVASGQVYLHDRSGARKASGSYYTKSFAVEHLLEGALEPALESHFKRLGNMDDTDAAEAFFDFRVADIAMGSGHFLISAIDRIEKRMADYLAGRALPGVRKELAALRAAASKELGDSADPANIEDSPLLRRLIARRCIYGVDLNGLAVQLSRLAVWLHTFVPGLPLSFLDHNLVRGNSLVGIAGIDDIRNALKKTEWTLFRVNAESLLGAATKPLRRLANNNDATLHDIDEARKASLEARNSIADTENLCDIITDRQLSGRKLDFLFKDWGKQAQDSSTLALFQEIRTEIEAVHALHFPIAFPEVFLRNRPGFDVILGNPPWQEATVEEHAFWARHFPRLRGLSQQDQESRKAELRQSRPDLVKSYETEVEEMKRVRRALVCGIYPGMGTGDPDLYKAFCWRFWNLSQQEDGHIGVVLPRSALAAKGSMAFRKAVFREAGLVDVTTLLNRAGWVFDDAEHRYTIGLVCIARGEPSDRSISLRGPYASEAVFLENKARRPTTFKRRDVLDWNDSASLPLLPHPDSAAVFAQLRNAPRLDTNSNVTGGGGAGALDQTASWTPLFRKISWSSISRPVLARPPRRRTPRHGAEGTHDVPEHGQFGWPPLAGVQGRVLRPVESRHGHLLRFGRAWTGLRLASRQTNSFWKEQSRHRPWGVSNAAPS